VDLFSYLFGSILAVGRAEVLQALVVSLLVLALLGAFFKEFLLESFDPQVAQASGLPVKLLQHLLLSAIALAVVVGIKLLGVVLASALLVAPAATALRLSSRYQKVLALAVLLSLACTMGGLLLAYWLDAAPGATIALCASGLFFASLLFPQRA
jgi:ABC-type Mn2+/Zn2+ transport system permease subunit